MKLKFNLLIFLLLLISAGYNAISQEILVSEYIYSGPPTSEWTELIVVEDKPDLRGFTIRDNSSNENWVGGARFKDLPFWQNIRRGTIIVMRHGGSAVDWNPDDGYLELSKEYSPLFEMYMDTEEAMWQDQAMNINMTHDMIQVRDASDDHVHVLAHMAGPSNLWNTIPNNKIGWTSTLSTGQMVCVDPGANLEDYKAGLTSQKTSSSLQSTLGRPNNKTANSDYWRSLRQPNWTNPQITNATLVNNKRHVKLTWNAASSISSDIEGYLIVRVEGSNMSFRPVDGKIYTDNEVIGNATIAGHVTDLTNTEFTDEFNGGSMPCGEEISYMVFPYRFNATDNPNQASWDDDPVNARGRSYNETEFARTNSPVKKELPPDIQISSAGNQTVFCANETGLLTAGLVDETKYNYRWEKVGDAGFSKSGTELVVSESGSYKLVLIDKESGCESESNIIMLEFIDSAEAFVTKISDVNVNLERDTIINLCGDGSIKLLGLALPISGENSFEWLRDGNPTGNTGSEIEVTSANAGEYRLMVTRKGVCPDTSYAVIVNFAEIDFTIAPAQLDFDADASPQQDITITNNSEQQLILQAGDISITEDDMIPNATFSVVAPVIDKDNPLVIPAGGNQLITIEFTMTKFGEETATLTINNPCGESQSAGLRGFRQNTGQRLVEVIPDSIDFGTLLKGCDDSNDSTFTIFVSGDRDILADTVIFNPNIVGINKSFPAFFFKNPDDDKDNQVRFTLRTNLTGQLTDTIRIPFNYLGETEKDTIKVIVTGNVIVPGVIFEPDSLDYTGRAACSATIDTFLTITNDDDYEYEIINQPVNPRLSIPGLPIKLERNSKMTIPVRITIGDGSQFQTQIGYGPCAQSSPPIVVIPPKAELQVFTPDSITETRNKCLQPGPAIFNVPFEATPEAAYIGEIIDDFDLPEIGLQINEGDIIEGETRFLLEIQETPEAAVLIDSIKFYIEPCHDLRTIYVVFEWTEPKRLEVSETEFDFGTEPILTYDTRTFTVTNENPFVPITIENVSVPAPFTLISHQPADFSIQIDADGGTEQFEIAYPRDVAGDFLDTLRVQVSEPCQYERKIALRGSAVDTTSMKVTISLPANTVYGEIDGSDIRFPIIVEADKLNFATEEINMKAYLRHNPSVVKFDDVEQGSSLESGTLTSANIIEDTPGEVIVDSYFNSGGLANGEWLILTGPALLGNTDRTDVVLDSVVFLPKRNLQIETGESGAIEVTGECDLQSRFLEVNGDVSLYLEGSNPVTSPEVLVFSTVSEEITTLSLLNAEGVVVRELINQSLKPGEHRARLDISRISSGMYYAILRTGTVTRTLKISVVK